MKKLILAAGLLVAVAAPLKSDAQVSINVNIGTSPTYWPAFVYYPAPEPVVWVRRQPVFYPKYRTYRAPAVVHYRAYPRYSKVVYVNNYRVPPGQAKKMFRSAPREVRFEAHHGHGHKGGHGRGRH